MKIYWITRLQRTPWSEFVVDKSLHITFVSTSWFNLVLSFQMFMLLTLSLRSSLSYRNQWTGFHIIGTSVLKELIWTLTHFTLTLNFYAPWKLQKIRGVSDAFGRYRNETLVWNGLIIHTLKCTVTLHKQPPRVIYKNVILKSFAIFTEKHLVSVFLNKFGGLQLYLKETPTQVFYCQYLRKF